MTVDNPQPNDFERAPDTYRLSPEQLSQQDGDHLARVGVELAEKAALLQTEAVQAPQAEQLSRAQSELVNADNPDRFHLAQRRLEAGSSWTEETRWLALEANRANQEIKGDRRLTFEEAKAKITSWANNDMASEDREAKRNGMQLDSALRGLDRPDPLTQREALATMLKDVEHTLAGYEQVNMARTPSVEAEVREYRAIRDALLIKRAEVTATAEGRAKEKSEAVEKEVQTGGAREKVAQAYEAAEAKSPIARDQSGEGAEDRGKKMLDMIPDDARERIPFAKQNFAEIKVDKIPLLTAYLQKEVVGIAERVPEGSSYPDTVATVLGNGGEAWQFLRAVVSAKQGGNIMEPDNFSRLSFSEVAQSLGIDVRKLVPDYDKRFRAR